MYREKDEYPCGNYAFVTMADGQHNFGVQSSWCHKDDHVCTDKGKLHATITTCVTPRNKASEHISAGSRRGKRGTIEPPFWQPVYKYA